MCTHTKVPTTKPRGKIHPLLIPTKPWDSIGMDFIGPFPKSKGHDYLWIKICHMTSMVHLIPVHTRMSTSELS
ncbi:hypothetical protein AN958_09083 [Leucoagaricus sp. SymC.cos]|nr:hypothetical protein AN958_09083 [Leucoagaricus sp. SymC.cos]